MSANGEEDAREACGIEVIATYGGFIHPDGWRLYPPRFPQTWEYAACEICGGGMRVADDVDEAICEVCRG